MFIPDKEELVAKIGELLLKSGITAGELASHNAAAVENALTFAIGKLPVLRMVPGGRERVRGLLLLAIDKLPKKMAEQKGLSSEAEVGACLAGIRSRVHALYGEAAATGRNHLGYDAAADVESSRLVRELEAVEQNPVVTVKQRIEMILLKAQIYGCWQKPHGAKGNQETAIACYESAIGMASGLPEAEAEIRYRYALFSLQAPKEVGGGKERAIENLRRAVDVAGVGSDLRLKCSEYLERQTKKRWSLFG